MMQLILRDCKLDFTDCVHSLLHAQIASHRLPYASISPLGVKDTKAKADDMAALVSVVVVSSDISFDAEVGH